MKITSIKALLCAGVLASVSAVPARANTILPSHAFGPNGTFIVYQAIHGGGELHPGDGFTVFDVGEYTGVISTPANWNSGAGLVGSPYGSAVIDDPTLANVHFIYVGPIIESIAVAPPFLPFVVGTTSLIPVAGIYRSQDHDIGALNVVGDGAPGAQNQGAIVVPFGPAGPGSVPDGGSTAALLGAVLVAFGMLRRRFLE